MKKLLVLIISISLFSLLSCSKTDIKNEENLWKRDFIIDVKNTSEFDNVATLKKTWILDTSENITLSSNVSWRVRTIVVRPWDKIYENQTLAVIEDNIANYSLNLASSKNALESAKNNLDLSKNSLDSVKNWLQTAVNNKIRAEINYDTNKLKLEKGIEDLKRNLNNLNIENENSSSFIEIQKIDNSINRINLEYDNLLLSNAETLAWFWRSLDRDIIVLKNFMDDVIFFWDEILGVTDLNKNKNNRFEIYLWAKNSSQKLESENLLRNLISFRNNDIKNLKVISLNEESYRDTIKILWNSYSNIIVFLNSLDTTLSNTVESAWAISQAEISAFKWNISAFRNIYNANNSQVIWLWNSISSFLETYKNSESSLLKQIENLEKDKNIYKTSLNLNVETNNATLDEAKQSMELTLRSLEVSISDAENAIIDAWIRVKDAESRLKDSEIRVKDAEIAYAKALDQIEKLTIKSPINWTISNINIDRWQEVSPWTPLFTILNETSNEVNISFTKDELDFVNEWSKVYYNDWKEIYTWTIYSISRNADANFKYNAKIVFPWQVTYIWNILSIEIPIKVSNKLVPINSIKINSSWIWTLNYYSSDWNIEQIEVMTWNIYWDKVEIIWEFDEDLQIILNHIDNFDSENFILKIKKEDE